MRVLPAVKSVDALVEQPDCIHYVLSIYQVSYQHYVQICFVYLGRRGGYMKGAEQKLELNLGVQL